MLNYNNTQELIQNNAENGDVFSLNFPDYIDNTISESIFISSINNNNSKKKNNENIIKKIRSYFVKRLTDIINRRIEDMIKQKYGH